MAMQYKLCNEYGDPSHDGHGQSEKVIYLSNKSSSEIDKLWEQAQAKFGISFGWGYGVTFSEDKPLISVCAEYEDSHMPYEAFRRLTDMGITVFGGEFDNITTEDEWDDATDSEIYMEVYDIFDIQMQMMKSIDETLEYQKIGNDYRTTNVSGGYGLFYM